MPDAIDPRNIPLRQVIYSKRGTLYGTPGKRLPPKTPDEDDDTLLKRVPEKSLEEMSVVGELSSIAGQPSPLIACPE